MPMPKPSLVNLSAVLKFRGLLLLLAGCCWLAPASADTELQARLRNRLEAGLQTESLEVMDERIHARETMRRVYPAREYAPIWVDENGLNEQGLELERWLSSVPARHGLRPADYHLLAIQQLDDLDPLSAIVDLELALTDSFLMVGSHLVAGRLNPETLDAEWVANRRHRDLAVLLDAAAGGEAPGAVLESLLPMDERYDALVSELARLRSVRDAGGWSSVAAGATLRPGDSGQRVEELAARLRATGSAGTTGIGAGQSQFAPELEAAVRAFQARHGLGVDGIVGAQTLAALNVPTQSRIDQIIVNLERWRWLPEDLGEYHVLVNIAAYSLDVIRDGESILDMRVVVGTPFRRTPVFSENISYLVLNPSWEVPSRNAIQDKLPLIKADPNYLAQQGYTVLEGWGEQERVVDPLSVDWSSVTARNFPYRLRQRPGPNNALGQVKFMFPNKFSVYLHDTPARDLFARDARAFSSGCIRLHDPLALAQLLLSPNPNWQRPAIDAALASGIEQTVRLNARVPVHLLYWTAWVDPEDGVLHFREDIYGRDQPVLRELRESPPS